jgi:hypothetical protein
MMSKPEHFAPLAEIVENYKEKWPAAALPAFADFLEESMVQLSSKKAEVDQVRLRATKNQTSNSHRG